MIFVGLFHESRMKTTLFCVYRCVCSAHVSYEHAEVCVYMSVYMKNTDKKIQNLIKSWENVICELNLSNWRMTNRSHSNREPNDA